MTAFRIIPGIGSGVSTGSPQMIHLRKVKTRMSGKKRAILGGRMIFTVVRNLEEIALLGFFVCFAWFSAINRTYNKQKESKPWTVSLS